MTVCYVGFSGDQRVDAEVLDALDLEAGMSIALFERFGLYMCKSGVQATHRQW
jgi:hypothetical protein